MALLAQASETPAAPVLAIMAFGVLLGIFGHLAGSRKIVATGIAILFLATALMVVSGFVAYQGGETDPRKEQDPRSPSF